MAGRLVFCVAFALYALTASPAMGWLDSPEFVATSAELGIAHSPGHPLPALLGHLAGYLPVGDLTFRVHVMSCLLTALAVLALMAAGQTLLRRVAPALDARLRTTMSAAAALTFGLSWACWYQAGRAEVYALQALLMVGLLASLIAYDEQRRARWLLCAGFLGGLALANHHFVALTLLVPGLIFVLARNRRQRPTLKTAALCAALGVVGLAAFLYLPVRSAQHPETNWGAPHTLERFVWTVSAKAFQKSVGGERPTTAAQDSGTIAMAITANVGLPLMALALLGLYFGLRRRGWRGLALLLCGTAGVCAGGRALIGFTWWLPDHHAYLVPALAALTLLALAGAGSIANLVAEARPRLGRGAAIGATAFVVLALPLQLAVHADDSNLRPAQLSDRVAAEELELLPPRTILLVAYYETSFRIAALRATQHSRPDVAILDLGFLTYPGGPEEAVRRYPELAALIETPLRITRPLPLEALRNTGRPVYVQLQPSLDPDSVPHLVPAGPFAMLTPGPIAERQRAAMERADVMWRERLGATLASPHTTDSRGVGDHLLWHDFNRLRYYCRHRRPTAWRPPTGGMLEGDCALTALPGEAPAPPLKATGAPTSGP